MVEASERMENVRASLDVYCNDNLVTTESLTVQWPGSAATGAGVNEYVVPRILTAVVEPGNYHRQAGATQHGQTRSILFQISIFLRYGSTNNLRRLEELRDLVIQYFSVGQSIALKDYFTSPSSPATDQQLRVHRINTDQRLPVDEAGYEQWVLAWDIQYLEQWVLA